MASSSQASSFSKKRKRDVAGPSEDTISIRMAPQDPGQLGPVLGMYPEFRTLLEEILNGNIKREYLCICHIASFPSIQPPRKTPFNTFLRKKPSQKDGGVIDVNDTWIAGESETVEFTTSLESKDASAGCKYLIGIHNKRTKTTTLIPAPLHILTRQVKSLKNLTPIDSNSSLPSSTQFPERMKLRNELGETFGTKKAKAAIRAQERNRVDVDAMKGVAGHLQDRIGENTESLPSKGLSIIIPVSLPILLICYLRILF